MDGKLIVFEGVEGAGKSTQLAQIHTWLSTEPQFQTLQQRGIIPDMIVTREPGGTALGATLRSLLLDGTATHTVNERAELLMYAADRAQHVDEVIRPALAKGCWVLCDRFVDSTVAYQGHGRGLDLALINCLNDIATGGLTSDLTLWLSLAVTTGLARSQRRGILDRMEAADLSFHQRVQRGFEALASRHPQRIVAVAADQDAEQVTQQIQAIIKERLGTWYGHHF
ncbi:dTMP kinase [Leptolyngbya sp. PCC 6406]|uniref:dTMP kinase n=1 Tax=Leptolyngbya sp. PCC 6406 TaxID=1173264 RepID=UPI0002AC872C|nr:dTMP kinase [Leptolyngbya sp. PCC 6406]